jgi:hypothetical protein
MIGNEPIVAAAGGGDSGVADMTGSSTGGGAPSVGNEVGTGSSGKTAAQGTVQNSAPGGQHRD